MAAARQRRSRGDVMIGRKGLVNTTLAAAVVIVGFGAYSTVGTSAASTGTVTNTATATSGNVLQTVSATGNVMAPLQAAATFTQAGVITKIMVKLGDVVTAASRSQRSMIRRSRPL